MAQVKVTVDGREYTTDDLTLDEAVQIEAETGETWLRMTPTKSAKCARAILTALHARTIGAEAARVKVGSMTSNEALDAMHVDLENDDTLPDVYENGRPDPKAEGRTTS